MPYCREFAQRGVLDGSGLLASLLADVVQALLATAGDDSNRPGKGGSSEAWVLASPFAAPDARDNAVGKALVVWYGDRCCSAALSCSASRCSCVCISGIGEMGHDVMALSSSASGGISPWWMSEREHRFCKSIHYRAHAGLVGLVYELAADVILPPMSGEPQGGAQGTQPSPEALGWLGSPNPTHVVLPAWIALGLPDPPPEVRGHISSTCWHSWHGCWVFQGGQACGALFSREHKCQCQCQGQCDRYTVPSTSKTSSVQIWTANPSIQAMADGICAWYSRQAILHLQAHNLPSD